MLSQPGSLVLLLSVRGLRVSVGLQSVLVSPAFYVRYKMLLLSIKAGLNLFQKKKSPISVVIALYLSMMHFMNLELSSIAFATNFRG